MTDYVDQTFVYRLGQVEKAVSTKAENHEVREIAEEVRGLRKALIGFIVTIAVSTCTFAGGVVALTTVHP